MAINIGDKIPDSSLRQKTSDGINPVTTNELFSGKKVVLFAVPGAFTPGCSVKHLPGYVKHSQSIKDKGIDEIVCMAVNDPHVMEAWGRDQNVGDKVMMLADGSAEFAKELGLDQDLNKAGMGVRSKRFAMIVDDSTVTELLVDEPGQINLSTAENILEKL